MYFNLSNPEDQTRLLVLPAVLCANFEVYRVVLFALVSLLHR